MIFENHEWRVIELDAVCTVTDCQHKTAPVVDYKTKFRMLRTTNIRNGRINSDDTRYVTEETYETWSVRGKLVEDDVILTREAPMGEVGIIKSSYERFFLGQRMLQLKAKADVILPYFLYYSLLAPEVQNQIKMHEGTGSVVSNIRIPALKKFKLKVPALNTQESVSRVLRLLDDKFDLNNAINKNLEEMAQALFKRWFIDFEFPNENGEPYKSSGGEFVESELGLIPRGWKIGTINDLCEAIFSGGTPSTRDESYWNGDYNWLSSGETRNSYIITTEKTITKAAVENSSTRLAKKYDVVIASAGQGSTRGQTSISLLDTYINQSIIALRANQKATYSSYLFFNLKGKYDELRQISDSNSIRGSLTTSMLKSYKVIVPPLAIQDQICPLLTSFIDSSEYYMRQNKNLSEQKDNLLPKLMSGEIVPLYLENSVSNRAFESPLVAENKTQYSTT